MLILYTPSAPPPKKHERGITLIESLIAIVVMALGLLGILGMQMRTLTDTQAGVRRAQAIRLIEDLGERLQNNPNALGNLGIYTTLPTSTEDCMSDACTPAELAAYDTSQWHSHVAQNLHGGQAIVFIPQGGSRQLGVMIGWNESRYNQNGKSFTSPEKTALDTPLQVSGTNSTANVVSCPSNLTCHLQFIQPSQRCTPASQGDGTLYCLN